MSEKYLISIVGPTAIGKTSLSITLAQHFNAEIISSDSRQFFKEMQIGTAAPNSSELQAAKHHFIHHKSVEDDYSVGAFEKDAIKTLTKLFLNRDVVIMVGGSGLYVDAVTCGLDEFPKVDKNIRISLNAQLIANGIETLQSQLKHLDEETYNKIALNNPQRIIRALEICIGTGKPYSSFLKKSKINRNFKVLTVGLTADREIIYERINKRVDIMMEQGLLEEVKTLKPKAHLNALNTVGYKELFNYLEKEWTLNFAVSEIKKNSRRFAKRQLTWFKRREETLWFNYDTKHETIISEIESTIKA
ncbi:MAG: tRNA (adenosine(37)-N6)-dimethylallyltransferase MiaA [Flavobacteriaceae bacterium]|uniref:tRNA (adenosine(37)-N6)-dimethylallyltransferase MiaA n=1 Tax=Bizionia echini TaxID=649333 RepID=UPI000C91B47E|nr:tRNA (adenosine(37)-N6)-dimethylallyltransferase MiaA [Flavobacteriaceae bacterium]